MPALCDIDISGRGLVELPADVLAAGPGTRKLNAANNSLASLPEDLAAHFPHLEVLFFLNNAFARVPEAVGSLPALTMLSFKSCRLQEVPAAALAPTLAWLILTDNRIPSLPRSLGRLPYLRKLMLASNELADLPVDELAAGGCPSLELVRLSDNNLSSPSTFSCFLTLPRLAWTAFAGNPITSGHRAGVRAACPRIPFADIDVDHTAAGRLGEGASGTVRRAVWRRNGAHASPVSVAVKLFKPASSDGRARDEVDAAIALPQHPCLVNTLGFVDEGEEKGASGSAAAAPASNPNAHLGLVLELLDAPPGSSSGWRILASPPSFATVTRDVYPDGSPSTTSRFFSLRSAVVVARSVAAAVAHMHAHGVCHGDVYAHNVLVLEEKGEGGGEGEAVEGGAAASPQAPRTVTITAAKLGDLGAAYFPPSSEEASGGVDERLWELVEMRAWGCLAEELLERCPGSTAAEEEEEEEEEGIRVSPVDTRALLAELRDACLQPDVRARPRAADVARRLEEVRV
jgi:hypothetical protein